MGLNNFFKAFKQKTTKNFTNFRFEYNHPVTLMVENNDEEFGTIVYDYSEEGLTVIVPRGKKTGQTPDLKVDDFVTLTIPQTQGAYMGLARVTWVGKYGQELITLALQEDWEERQDREFYRLAVTLPLRYAPVTRRGLNPEDFRSSRTIDLSGGGAKFPVDGLHRRGDLLYVQFDIMMRGDIQSIILTGKVVRIEQSLSLGTIVAVQFADISDREQKLLVEWVGSQQSQV